MKFKKALVLTLTLPLLLSGCSNHSSVNEYTQVNQASAFNYVNEVKENNKFDLTGYEFNSSVINTIKVNGKSSENKYVNSGVANINNGKLEYAYNSKLNDTQIGEVYIIDNTLYLKTPSIKGKISITSSNSNNSLVSVPDFQNEFIDQDNIFESIKASSDDWKFYKRVDGDKTYYKFVLDSSVETLSNYLFYEFMFVKDQLFQIVFSNKFSANYLDNGTSLEVNYSLKRSDKKVEVKDLESYTTDNDLLVEYGFEIGQ